MQISSPNKQSSWLQSPCPSLALQEQRRALGQLLLLSTPCRRVPHELNVSKAVSKAPQRYITQQRAEDRWQPRAQHRARPSAPSWSVPAEHSRACPSVHSMAGGCCLSACCCNALWLWGGSTAGSSPWVPEHTRLGSRRAPSSSCPHP